MKTIHIVRGIPGSGKSTHVIKNRTASEDHFEADMFFYTNPEHEYRFDVSRLHQAHLWCQDAVRRSLEAGKTVWVSNTFTTFKEVKPYLELAHEFDAAVDIQTIETYYGSIHNVPDETIERMRARFIPKREFDKMVENYLKTLNKGNV